MSDVHDRQLVITAILQVITIVTVSSCLLLLCRLVTVGAINFMTTSGTTKPRNRLKRVPQATNICTVYMGNIKLVITFNITVVSK